jgi:hypothetical protein
VTSSPAKPHGDLEAVIRAVPAKGWYCPDGENVYTFPEEGAHGYQEPIWIGSLTSEAAEYLAAANPARVLSLIGEVRELRDHLEKCVAYCEPLINELWESGKSHPTWVTTAGGVLQDARRALLDRDA